MIFKNRRIVSRQTRVILILGYIIFITLFDSYTYGIIYQQKIQKDIQVNSFWSWVFVERGQESNGQHITVPHYRVLQKSVEIFGALVIFYFCGFWSFLGIIISHYLLTYDLLFYITLNQAYLFHEFQNQNSPYWLQNWYQIGYFVLKPFNPDMFYMMGIGGIVVAAGLSLIKVKKKKEEYNI